VQQLAIYLDYHSDDILFNVAAIVMFYLLARLISARPPIALAFAFMPVLAAWAFKGATVSTVFRTLF
jgi:hypothetical protein